MTIAEAGTVGRIKHNFSVMVRGVGFSTLIISSASQSRPLSRPPAPLSARGFLSIFRFRYRYALAPGNTFPCIFLGHSTLSPSRFSSAELPPSAFYPIRQLSSPSPILSPSRSLSPLFLPSFSCFNYQLFPVSQKFALKRAAFSRRQWWFLFRLLISFYLPPLSLSFPFAVLPHPFFFIQSSRFCSPTIHPAVRFRYMQFSSAKHLCEAQIYTVARRARRIGKSCNAPLFIRRLPPLFYLFIRLFNSLPASDRLRNVICQRLCSVQCIRANTQATETLEGDACSPRRRA